MGRRRARGEFFDHCAPASRAVLLFCFLAVLLSGCGSSVEYVANHFPDITFTPRKALPTVVAEPEMAIRLRGYVNTGEILIRGRVAYSAVLKEAAKRGADVVYLKQYAAAKGDIVADEHGNPTRRKPDYFENYYQAKLFRYEPEMAGERGFLFALASPHNQPDAGGYFLTPEQRCEYIAAFLDGGADPNTHHHGDPVLFRVVTSWYMNFGASCFEVVQMLLEAGADPSVRSSSGDTLPEAVDRMIIAMKEMSDRRASALGSTFDRAIMHYQFVTIRDLVDEWLD